MTAEASFFALHDLDDLGVVCLSVHFGEVKSAQVAVADPTVQHAHESVMASLFRGESEAVPRALRSAKEGSGHELERGRVNFDIGSSVGLARHCGRRRRGGCPSFLFISSSAHCGEEGGEEEEEERSRRKNDTSSSS